MWDIFKNVDNSQGTDDRKILTKTDRQTVFKFRL